MKIVHCIYSFNTGGAETMLVDIMNEQVTSHDVTLIIVNDSYSQILLDRIDKRVKIVKLGRPHGSRNPWYFLRLNIILFGHRTDVVHLHSSSLTDLLFGIRNKLFYTCHDVGIDFSPKKVAKVFAISRAVKEDIQGHYRADNVFTVTNGIKLEDVKIKVYPHIPANRVMRIINVARLDLEKKGQDILIRAIALLRDKGIDNLCVDFIGEGRSRELLEKLSEDLNVSEQVCFLGLKAREYIYQHLCDYDLMCHPSRFEGFGLTVAEGMAAKLPVLVATGDGPYEIIEHGRYGYSFENGDEASCADTLEYILNNYEEAVGKTEQAWCHIRDNYSIQNTAQRYLKEYVSK
ncbi:glycosyltransferase [Porphyromonas gingivalis]|uniref:glycosyltransferase n=1 Tax=Porphyromonas gingivalis TaxID=837 RepID=UPI000974FCD2|nr:glycosyltransferase [Porphyromonas gingivalis]ATR93279.1 glycosyltransferase [Porphyromonas gingivalis]ATS08282.1 glycosyltransferase [Porphyromonas gingivalis]SJL23437.1 glycosyl transferase [Porphyromonas gingivalis]